MKTATCCWLTLLCIPASALAQTFAFEVGSPVAAQDFRFKSAAFVFRTTGCAEPEKAEISANAEGIVDGARRSIALKPVASAKPGVYAVVQQWTTGHWAVVLKGTCGASQAGAIIPVGQSGLVREAAKFFTRPVAPAEVETALKAFPEGGYK
jgi:hypothetical protein